ncbi:MAG: ubiquitin elongating factor core-domain-containing protein [Olpidium bornovanus]|uniref:Ubiquitin elongating factor core-domain-containing protein n=1 Tax=Olpidium bornovanus TaxID=278681 RepID=A0A8H8DLI6_9FUNG|nr:MAG: ubiquitin elongating factor core-domain-containing protein [Olpidium bornovanus]
MADRALVARLSLEPAAYKDSVSPAEQVAFDYLVACWKRAAEIRQGTANRAAKIADASQRIEVLDEVRALVVSYAGLPRGPIRTAADAALYASGRGFARGAPGGAAGRAGGEVQGRRARGAVRAGADRRVGADDNADRAHRLPVAVEGKPVHLRHSTFARGHLRASIGSPSDAAHLKIMTTLLEHQPIAAMITTLPNWNPPGTNAKTIELLSIMGPFLRLSLYPTDDPMIGEAFFSSMENRSRDDIESAITSLRGSFAFIQSALFNIFNLIVRASPQSRQNVLSYFGTVIARNAKRAQMQVDRQVVSGDGFITNIGAVLLSFSFGFIDVGYTKISKIDPDYLRLHPDRINVRDDTKMFADQEESDNYYNAAAAEKRGKNPPNFVTECFFLTAAVLHYGFLRSFVLYTRFIDDLRHLKREYDTLKAEQRRWASVTRFPLLTSRRCVVGPPGLTGADCVRFAVLWVDAAGGPERESDESDGGAPEESFFEKVGAGRSDSRSGLPVPVPAIYEPGRDLDGTHRELPRRWALGRRLSGESRRPAAEPTAIDAVEMPAGMVCRGRDRVLPFPREIIFDFTLPFHGEPEGGLGAHLNTHPLCVKHLVPSVMHFYVGESQHIAAHGEFGFFSVTDADKVARVLISRGRANGRAFAVLRQVQRPAQHLADPEGGVEEPGSPGKGPRREQRLGVVRQVRQPPHERHDLPAGRVARETEGDQQHPDGDGRPGLGVQVGAVPEGARRPAAHGREAGGVLRGVRQRDGAHAELSDCGDRGPVHDPGDRRPVGGHAGLQPGGDGRTEAGQPQGVSAVSRHAGSASSIMTPRAHGLLGQVKKPEKYTFQPKALLKELLQIYIHLAHRHEFVLAVARDGRSYSKTWFSMAAAVMLNNNLMPKDDIDRLEKFVGDVEAAIISDLQTEEELGEAPDEFLGEPGATSHPLIRRTAKRTRAR